MPDPYMPDVQVEIAFNAGYTTPDASRTWTDVSDYVELEDKIAIGFGRQDERSTADANNLTLTLDNSDGRFTAGLQHLANRVVDPNMTGDAGSWSPLGSPGFQIQVQGNAPGQTNSKALTLYTSGTYQQVQEPEFPVTPDSEWRVQAYGWVQSTATGTGDLLAAIWFFDSAGAFISAVGPTWSPSDAGAGWIQREATGTAPANTATAKVVVRGTAGLTSGAYLIDAVKVQQVNPYYPNVKVGRPIRVTATPPKNILAGAAPSVLGAATLTSGVSYDGDTWHRVQPTTNLNGVRYQAALADLVDGETYTASVEIANDTGDAQTVTLDWCDTPSTAMVLQPGTRARLYATGTRADYTSTFRFMDVVAANGANFLVRAPMLTPGTAQVEYRQDAGSTSTRYVGFIDEWPVEWDGTDAYAKATIRAASRRARLGLSTKLRSMPEEAILAARPVGYWTLGDPADSTAAADSSGRLADPLVVTDQAGMASPAIVFGNATGPGTDGLTAAEFADGQYLEGTPSTAPRAFHAAFRTTVDAGSVMRVGNLNIYVEGGGALRANLNGGGSTLTGPDVNDGATHDVVLTFAPAGTCELYVDGVLVDSDTGGTDPSGALRVGIGFTGTIAHVAYYDATSSTPDAEGIALAVAGTAERTDERLTRLLGWAGVAASEISTQTGDETMTYQLTTGQSVVDALQEVESTEGGVLFDGADGRVTFHNRSHRYLAATEATFDMASQQVESDYAPKLDRTTLVNDATVENPTTERSARYSDSDSIDEYGVASTTATSVVDDDDRLQQKAAWLVTSYAEPRPRVPSLTVDLLAQVGGTPSAADILALTVGSRVTVTNQPAQADTTDADYFVEGYTEAIGPQSYRITFNLSPTYPSLSTFVLNNETRGKLDSTYVLAL